MDKILTYQYIETLHENDDVLVFRAENLLDNKKVIVKSIKSSRPSLEQLAALRHEFQINNGVHLKGLVRCQQLIEQSDAHLLIFDDTGGVSLQKYLKGQAISLELFFPIAIEMVNCLKELHTNNIIHKDIKPDNILIDPETLAIKMLDLSIASQLTVENQEVVSVNKLEGSLPYIAPEQTGRMNRSIDYRSDYYSLGITFYQMLTGTLPFVGADALAYVHYHLAMTPKSVSEVNPTVPAMLSNIVSKLRSKEAEDRYQSAEGLQADLERCFQEWSAKQTISDFTLGQHEVLNNLVISPKIYGRDKEIETLLSTFDRVAKGASECLMISGYSGVGKTRLVNEVQKPITSQEGYFISGKFDLLQRSTPYTAFTQAFSKLFKQWLTESDAKLSRRKENLLKALGESGQVIIEFFPELEIILGKQPEIERLPPEQAQNRFLYYFQNFLECISSPEEPLVIFIDDLQWIDQGSLLLLENILTAQDVRSFLFIGAYRDNEVDKAHPLIKLLDKLKKAKIVVENIILKPLELVDTQEFLADSLRMDGKSVTPLAEMLFDKTAGNPFFALEFLKECFSQNLLLYDHNESLWHWNLEEMGSLSGSDNVIDLMLAKISKLPEESKRLLQIGSCLGMSFDSWSLSDIEESDELDLLEHLSPIIKAGMLQRIDGGLRYKFIHDRIQQAAYQTVSESEKRSLHLKIGRMLLGKQERLDSNEGLFELLDHFRLCLDLLEDAQENAKLAEPCLRAGRQAIGSGAYHAAADYLSFGLALAKEMSWEDQHSLLWDLNMELMESLYLEREAEKAMELSLRVLAHAVTIEEKLTVYKLQLKTNIIRGAFKENLTIYDSAVSILGLSAPPKVSKLRILLEYLRMRFLFGTEKKFVKAILNFKIAKDNRAYLLWELSFYTSISCSYLKITLNQFMLAAVVARYTQKHGAHEHGQYLIINGWSYFRYSLNKSLSEQKIYFDAYTKISNNFEQRFGRVGASVPDLIPGGYFENIRDLQKQSENVFNSLIETGIFSLLEAAASIDIELLYFCDVNLSELEDKVSGYLGAAKKLKQKGLIDFCNCIDLSTQHLMSESTTSLGKVIHALSDSETKGAGVNLVFNFYLEENYKAAKGIVSQTANTIPSVAHPNHNAIKVLVLAQLYPEASLAEKSNYRKEIKKALKELKRVSDQNPDNFLHLYLIGQTELARIEGEHKKALDLYHQTITAATEQGFIRWAAIANERVGELYLELGDPTAASAYFQEAIYFFRQWGCMLKVDLLQKKYGKLLTGKHVEVGQELSQSGTTTTLITGELDLMTMLKANQAISSEIQLDKLLPRILLVVVESAGADKAAFIGLKKNNWVIESQGVVQAEQFTSSNEPEILTPDSNLPEGLISFVIRSGNIEVIGDLSKDPKYTQLPYVLKHQPKSALCLPIVRNNKVIAALYLENNLAADAFTPDRVQLLQALSAQIAISLENARNFEHTQELFRSTERFVPKKFLELLGRNNIEEVVKGDNARVEMSAIFADLRDFTTISESIEPEQLTYVLNTYLKYMAPIIRNNNGFVNRVLGDGILALFPNEPQDAVQASVEMLQALHEFNKEINEAGFDSIVMGIGVNTGPAMLCALGEEERIEANVVSDMVNAASRIEGLNKIYGTKLLISDFTYNKLKNLSKFSIRKVDTVRVKGKTKPMDLYEVLPAKSGERNDEYFAEFNMALGSYTKGDFKAAKKAFEECLLSRPEDSVARLYADRCKAFQEKAPENWDGVTTMLEK